VGCNGGVGEQEEVRRRVLGFRHVHLLAVAVVEGLACQGGGFSRKEGKLGGHHVGGSHALGQAGQSGRLVRVAEVHVLVLGLHQLVSGRRNYFDDVDSGIEAREAVPSVENSGAYLVPVSHAVVALGVEVERIFGIPRAARGQVGVPAVGGGRGHEGLRQGDGVHAVKVYGHVGNARLPGLAKSIVRIVLGPSGVVEDHSRNSAGFPFQVIHLAPFHDVGLTQEGLERLGQDGTRFRSGQVVSRVGVRHGLDLRIQTAVSGKGLDGGIDRTARIHDGGDPGGLHVQEVHLGHQPVEEREHLGEMIRPVRAGGGALVDGPVPPPDIDRSLTQPYFGGIRGQVLEPVLVGIVEDLAHEVGEPIKNGDLIEVAGPSLDRAAGPVGPDGNQGRSDDDIQRFVPDDQLPGARRDAANGKIAVGVAGTCEDSLARCVVQSDPRIGKKCPGIESVVGGAIHVIAHHLALDGGPARKNRGVFEGTHKPENTVMPRGSELGKVGGLVGLDPRVDGGRTFDGARLDPIRAYGGGNGDPVLGRRKVLNEGQPVGVGHDDAVADGLYRPVRLVGGTQGIAESVLGDEFAVGSVAAPGFPDVHNEAFQPLFLGKVRHSVDPVVVLEDKNRNLGRG